MRWSARKRIPVKPEDRFSKFPKQDRRPPDGSCVVADYPCPEYLSVRSGAQHVCFIAQSISCFCDDLKLALDSRPCFRVRTVLLIRHGVYKALNECNALQDVLKVGAGRWSTPAAFNSGACFRSRARTLSLFIALLNPAAISLLLSYLFWETSVLSAESARSSSCRRRSSALGVNLIPRP